MSRTRRIVNSVAFYPVTAMYVAAMLATAAVVGGVLRFDVALLLLGVFAVIVILWSMSREVGKVHALVNSQHDVMVEKIGAMADRIDQLLDALTAAGVEIPHDKAGVDRERKPE